MDLEKSGNYHQKIKKAVILAKSSTFLDKVKIKLKILVWQLSDFSESIRLIYRLVKLGLFSLAYFDMLEYHIGNDYLVTAPKAK